MVNPLGVVLLMGEQVFGNLMNLLAFSHTYECDGK